MFIIGEALIEENIAHERFACDLPQCHGACCTLPGGRGAPLNDDEVVEIQRAFPFAMQYLSSKHLDVIRQNGMVEGSQGNYATACIDDKDCVFVSYEGSIARCALEKAYIDGKTSWRKPLSCHLFPLRISNGTIERIRYEKIADCHPAISRGVREDIPLYEFLRDALVRKYGEEWYLQFREACRSRDHDHDAVTKM
ncbi:MAG TPA: DUF3109 family protein [Bacteroidota bacterium]|nr:DUF3109 family protein [Bacteroidota bacterium]